MGDFIIAEYLFFKLSYYKKENINEHDHIFSSYFYINPLSLFESYSGEYKS